jgi:hypothetical protein
MYNRRDQIGHWVRKEQPQHRHCTHACCRGYREHPDNWPIIPAKRSLRSASDEKLAAHYAKVTADESPQARGAELQIIHEFERRDREQVKRLEKERHRQAVRAARTAKAMELDAERERIRVAAEAATRGYMVNAKGRVRGINPDEILTGREAVFRRYASDEAKEYFASNPRPTASYFRGQDTRVVERASEPRRRQRGVVSR